jgi:hypothetical protein
LQTVGDMLDMWNLPVHHGSANVAGLLGHALARLPISPTAMALGMAACFGGAIQIDRGWALDAIAVPPRAARGERRVGI